LLQILACLVLFFKEVLENGGIELLAVSIFNIARRESYRFFQGQRFYHPVRHQIIQILFLGKKFVKNLQNIEIRLPGSGAVNQAIAPGLTTSEMDTIIQGRRCSSFLGRHSQVKSI